MSETCPTSQGRDERYIVRTDESEGLTRYPGAVNPSDPAYAGPPPFTQGRRMDCGAPQGSLRHRYGGATSLPEGGFCTLMNPLEPE